MIKDKSNNNNDNETTTINPKAFEEFSDEFIQKLIHKALIRVVPPLLEDEDIVNYIIDELLTICNSTKESFSELSHLEGEKQKTSLTSIQNVLTEHLLNFSYADNEDDANDLCEELQQCFQEIRIGNTKKFGIDLDSEDDDDGQYVEDGCCLLCEREMPLTRHHVIPKHEHKKYLKKGTYTKDYLARTILICRVCHDAIHSFIALDEMAEEYNTLEKIKEHPKVKKWIPYIAKQKNTKKFRY